MTNEELKQAYYKLALAELNHRYNQVMGRPWNKQKWDKLAYLICMAEVSLYEACNATGILQSDVYRRKLRFIGARSITTTKQGNLQKKVL